MNTIRTFITAKTGSPISSSDDHFAYKSEKLNFAVSDGSSCSLASRIYSRMLVDHFVDMGDEMFNLETCSKLTREWRAETARRIEEQGNPYYLTNLLNSMKPADATFVGLSIYQENATFKWKGYSIGDSVLFFFPKEKDQPIIQVTTNSNESLEFNPNIVFSNNPFAASTYNHKWLDKILKTPSFYLEEGVFVMMTDALAEWFLQAKDDTPENKFKILLNLTSQEEFVSLIAKKRSEKTGQNESVLHDDDVTLMIIEIDDLITFKTDKTLKEIVRNDYRPVIVKEEQESLIRSLIERNKGLQEKVTGLTEQLENRNQDITKFSSQIVQQDSKIKGLNEQLMQKNNDCINLNSQLLKKIDVVAELKSQIVQQDSKIKGLNEQLIQKNNDYINFNSQLSKKDDVIAELRLQIVQKDIKIKEGNEQLIQKNNDCTNLNSQLLKKDDVIAELKSQIVQKDNTITSLNIQLLEQDHLTENLQDELKQENNNLEKKKLIQFSLNKFKLNICLFLLLLITFLNILFLLNCVL